MGYYSPEPDYPLIGAPEVCEECEGTGTVDYVDDGGPGTCDTCHGEGRYYHVTPDWLIRERGIAADRALREIERQARETRAARERKAA